MNCKTLSVFFCISKYSKEKRIYLAFLDTGGPLASNTEFRLALITFSFESRHWFGGNSYPMEAEIYFYNLAHGTFNKAITKQNGVVALGLIFKVIFFYFASFLFLSFAFSLSLFL